MPAGRPTPPVTVRRAQPADADVVAVLLHDFNTEFAEPSPGPAVLATRLQRLLASETTLALLAGEPAAGVALLTLRPNVWYDTPVALLDELYVTPGSRNRGIGSALLTASCALVASCWAGLMEINVDGEDVDARRFYESHGFGCTHGQPPQPALCYSRKLE